MRMTASGAEKIRRRSMDRIGKMILAVALTAVMLFNVVSPAFGWELSPDELADYADGAYCEYCGEWRYDDWLCSGGNHCAAGCGCGDDHHCTECGACESWGDFCETCTLCLDCAMDNHQHCPECGACGQEVGGCNFCGCCFDCSPQCGAACEDLCLECHIELGLACCECGNCYVDGSVDYCPECMLCSDCMYADYCDVCGMCGYCAYSINGTHCSDCMACTKEEGCLLCGRCFDCGGRCKDGCGELCLECHLDEDAACPDCGNCFVNDNHKRCGDCGRCEDCGGGFCETCGLCMDCCLNQGLHCPGCQGCNGEAELFCQSCGYCSDCALVCPECRESCSECCSFYCLDCGSCSNCKDICELCQRCEDCTVLCTDCRVRCADCVEMCENCQTCENCAQLCPECGEACSSCAVICPWCELCEECCGEITRDAGCDHGVCVMDPDWEDHWTAEHSGLMVRLSVDKSAAVVDEPITWTATAFGATGAVQYSYDVYWEDADAHLDDFVYESGWTSSPSLTFSPALPGEYMAWLSVKDGTGKTVDLQGGRVVVRYAADSLRISSVTAKQTSAVMGQTITWTAAVEGGSGAKQYRFDVYRDTTIVARTAYSGSNQVSWKTSAGGVYKVKAYVKDAAGKEVSKLSETTPVLEVLSAVPDRTGAAAGEYIYWTVTMVGETAARQIRYDLYRDGQLVEPGFPVATPNYGFILAEPGVYSVRVTVQDAAGSFVLESEAVNVGLPLPALRGKLRKGQGVLSWSEIPGAEAYYVYRRDNSGGAWGSWGLKYRGSETSWTDETTAESGKCEYRVRAMTGEVLGGFSNSVILGPNPFSDIGEDKWYFDAVLWACYHEPQITGGTGDGKFSPNADCTREQVVSFLYAAENKPAFSQAEKPLHRRQAGEVLLQGGHVGRGAQDYRRRVGDPLWRGQTLHPGAGSLLTLESSGQPCPPDHGEPLHRRDSRQVLLQGRALGQREQDHRRRGRRPLRRGQDLHPGPDRHLPL